MNHIAEQTQGPFDDLDNAELVAVYDAAHHTEAFVRASQRICAIIDEAAGAAYTKRRDGEAAALRRVADVVEAMARNIERDQDARVGEYRDAILGRLGIRR